MYGIQMARRRGEPIRVGSGRHATLDAALTATSKVQAESGLVRGLTGRPLLGFALPQAAHAESGQRDTPANDAWFASFGSSISRILSSGQAVGADGVTSSMVQESVMGWDDRQQVTNTVADPFLWTCELTIHARNGTLWQGTGWLAAPNLVVTAGHCVFMHNQGGWATAVEIRPSRNGGYLPYQFTSTLALSVAGWVNDKQPASDYGALVLSNPDAAMVPGYYGYAALPDHQISGELINVVGYPVDKPRGTMWGHARVLSSATPDELIYLNDTYGGMSGCPVIRWDGQDFQVLGIHNYGDLAGNRATRISPDVFNNIKAWAQVRD